MDNRYKSHFSHICNKIENVTLRADPGEVSGTNIDPISQKTVPRLLRKSSRLSTRFLIDLGSILGPMDNPQIEFFHQSLLLVSLLGHLGAKSARKVSRDNSNSRFIQNVISCWVNLKRIWKMFKLFSMISSLISHRVFYFRRNQNNLNSICNSNSQLLARWQFDTCSALDMEYVCMCICIHTYIYIYIYIYI